MSKERELLELAVEWIEAQQEPRMIGANDIIKEIRVFLSTPEPTQDEEPVSNTDIYPFCGVVKMPEGWNTFANQETDTNPSECIALIEVRLWDDGKECYYKTLSEDLPIGTYELYLAEPKVPFVRLTEEEVTEILTSAYDMYAAICAVENRLVEKNRG